MEGGRGGGGEDRAGGRRRRRGERGRAGEGTEEQGGEQSRARGGRGEAGARRRHREQRGAGTGPLASTAGSTPPPTSLIPSPREPFTGFMIHSRAGSAAICHRRRLPRCRLE